jgi:hypothetical protein
LAKYSLLTYAEINTNPSYALENMENYSQRRDITKVIGWMKFLMKSRSMVMEMMEMAATTPMAKVAATQ